MAQKGHLKTKAIVIKGINYGESDKILSVISETYGKMTLLSKSARKPGNKLAASSQFLCYSEFLLYKSRDFPVINSADVIDPFIGIAEDMDRLRCAAHCCELAYDCSVENQPADNIVRLLLNTLYVLSRGLKDIDMSARVFELRLLSDVGYTPHLKNCVLCSDDLTEPYVFSWDKGGLVCSNCRKSLSGTINISLGTVKTIYHITNSRIDAIFSFKVSDKILEELWRFNTKYITAHLGKYYTKFQRMERKITL